MVKRLSPRWVFEVLGVISLCVAAFTVLLPLGFLAIGIGLVVEASLGEPLKPEPKRP